MSLLSSLSNRIFLASALLAVLSIAVAVFVVNRTVTGRAEGELERSLEEAGTLVEQFQSLLFEHLVREARLIADLPKLKAGVDTKDAATVQPLAEDYRQQIDADLFLVTDGEGRRLGLATSVALSPDAVKDFGGTREALLGRETVAFWPRQEGMLQVVSVPIYLGPQLLGTLTAGVTLDRRLAERIKSLTHSDVVFGSQGTIHAATVSEVYRPSLVPLLTSPGVSHVTLGGVEYVAVRRLLTLGPAQRGVTPNPGTDGPASLAREPSPVAPVAIILRSRTEHLQLLRTLHSSLAVTALLAVLGATLLSFFVARTITRPLGALIATMREMAATGDLTRVQPPPASESRRWEDEDARVLASTFRALTESLGRFQHEAAQRERLSSLGRLSTVIAHEIRNPLMIIKASLRTLKRDVGTQPDAAGAIGDIEEEVGRLNGLVNEVLDYARPIRFEFGRVDLNALCRDAATAATPGQTAPTVRVVADAGVGEVVTDAERLRLVLVNVLTNARDAVLAEHAGVLPAQETVELRTDCPTPEAIGITVVDRGQGIAPEHLARIFDPFFTTKRTGSGLGLAIAKNIIEGLGGTIAIASAPHRGTTVRITLPRTAPADVNGQLSEWAS